jgi:hypothetical protein
MTLLVRKGEARLSGNKRLGERGEWVKGEDEGMKCRD